jgi:hypothetical protein
VELDTASINHLVDTHRAINDPSDQDLYLTPRGAPRFCLVSVAQSDSAEGTDSAQNLADSGRISIVELVRAASWNSKRDAYEGDFALFVDCYSSEQRVEATSQYTLNRDYDTRAHARGVETCNRWARGGR